jgi:hypothetical protein
LHHPPSPLGIYDYLKHSYSRVSRTQLIVLLTSKIMKLKFILKDGFRLLQKMTSISMKQWRCSWKQLNITIYLNYIQHFERLRFKIKIKNHFTGIVLKHLPTYELLFLLKSKQFFRSSKICPKICPKIPTAHRLWLSRKASNLTFRKRRKSNPVGVEQAWKKALN